MTENQLTEQVMRIGGEVAALRESVKSAHHRIDENDQIIESVYKLATSVETLAVKVELLAEGVEGNIKRLEEGQKSQGERIGALEKEPGNRWKALVAQIIGIIAAALVGGVVVKFIN